MEEESSVFSLLTPSPRGGGGGGSKRIKFHLSDGKREGERNGTEGMSSAGTR